MMFKTIEEANRWLAFHIKIDRKRIDKTLKTRAEYGLETSKRLIYSPSEMVERKVGQCQDVARLGYEVAKVLGKTPKYVVFWHWTSVLRYLYSVPHMHWVVAYKDRELWFVFADSRNLGRIFGPYKDLQTFAKEYIERYSARGTKEYFILDDMEWSK